MADRRLLLLLSGLGAAVALSLYTTRRRSRGGGTSEIRERARRMTVAATSSGAVKKLSTTGRAVVDGPTGVQFFVSRKNAVADAGRKASGAAAKAAPVKQQRFDPFAVPEEALLVEPHLTATHYLMLNKFPIVDDHLLVITKAFEMQTDVATFEDFEALRATLSSVDGFVFYNCGARSGASQPHKHFQLLPRDTLKLLEADGDNAAGMTHEIPMEALVDQCLPSASTPPLAPTPLPSPLSKSGIVVARLPHGWERSSDSASVQAVLGTYESMLQRVGLPVSRDGVDHCSDRSHPSHNMVMTKSWLMVAARQCDPCPETGLGSNACGFGGFFLVRDDAELAKLEARGPAQALIDVCAPARQ